MGAKFVVNMSGLRSTMAQLSTNAQAAARPAAQAAAQVLYNAVVRNVERLGSKTGNLRKSIYQVYSKDQSSATRATYHVGWNHKVAPHGFNVEFGHFIRYKYYVDKKGDIRPMVRPEMQGKPRPKRDGRGKHRAAFDRYYVPLPGGPRKIPGKFFLRGALDAVPAAQLAAKNELIHWIKFGRSGYKAAI